MKFKNDLHLVNGGRQLHCRVGWDRVGETEPNVVLWKRELGGGSECQQLFHSKPFLSSHVIYSRKCAGHPVLVHTCRNTYGCSPEQRYGQSVQHSWSHFKQASLSPTTVTYFVIQKKCKLLLWLLLVKGLGKNIQETLLCMFCLYFHYFYYFQHNGMLKTSYAEEVRFSL